MALKFSKLFDELSVFLSKLLTAKNLAIKDCDQKAKVVSRPSNLMKIENEFFNENNRFEVFTILRK